MTDTSTEEIERLAHRLDAVFSERLGDDVRSAEAIALRQLVAERDALRNAENARLRGDLDEAVSRADAPERIWAGPSLDDKGEDWTVGHFDADEDENCVEYIRADAALATMPAAAVRAQALRDAAAIVDAASEGEFRWATRNKILAMIDKPAHAQDQQHFDDTAVKAFAQMMADKMAASRSKGRGGWDDPEQCSVEYLQQLLREHIAKGDPVDVANICMMLRHYDAPTSDPAQSVADAARVLLTDDIALSKMAEAMHDGPLLADEYEFRADTKAGGWCLDCIRAALRAISTTKEGE